ncbi:MAG: DUF1727 domain-containing protein, partial [Chloroflexota bacterium]|nr:DUF1727 domain-containing protein [Chloroflexota bacterium]
MAELSPRAVVCLNLFRDQLDRYGELDHLARLWAKALARLPASAAAILNADDPRIADLGSDLSCKVVYFGLEAPEHALPIPQHAADSLYCPRCGGLLDFHRVYYAHIGQYRCASCGWAHPRTSAVAHDLQLSSTGGSRFFIGEEAVCSQLPGVYNVYNVLAAFAAATTLALDPAAAIQAIASFSGAFGRTEIVQLEGREVRLLLAKNPVGFNEVIRTIGLAAAPLDLYLALNDRIADGQDVSWIWDVDFELLAARCHSLAIAGTRGDELAMRLRYAG